LYRVIANSTFTQPSMPWLNSFYGRAYGLNCILKLER
jgi:hypothetical protein